MYALVYCFKLDEFEFNLKSKYKKYKPVISRHSRALYVFSMTPKLQDDIGTVGYVEFVSPDEVKVDDEIVSIEASKTVIDVQTPLSGTIIERNTKAEEEPTILNSEKPEENWLFKLDDVDKEAFLALPEA